MESTAYGDNPTTIKWYRTVFGGKADELTLEQAFEAADDTTLFVVPQSMLETFQGMTFILGKRVGIKVMTPETPPFEFNNYSSIDAVYPYPLSKVRRKDSVTAFRPDAQLFRPEKEDMRSNMHRWRDNGIIL